MGITIQIADANFSRSLTSLTIPDRRGLVGEYILGGNAVTSVVNHANADLPLSLIGTPTYGPNYARVLSGTGGYGFATGIVPATDSTHILIRKRPSGYVEQAIVGNSGAALVGFYDRSNSLSIFHNRETGIANGAQSALPVAGTSFFEAGVSAPGAGFGRKYHYAAGVQVESVSATPAVASVEMLPFLIGAIAYSTVATPYDIHYYACFNRTLTPTEIDDVYRSLKAFMAARGITI